MRPQTKLPVERGGGGGCGALKNYTGGGVIVRCEMGLRS